MDRNHHTHLQNVRYPCACCGEPNHTWPDPGGSDSQEFIEDCRVCCRPNIIHASRDEEGRWRAKSRSEDD